jgi:hypothetical protein
MRLLRSVAAAGAGAALMAGALIGLAAPARPSQPAPSARFLIEAGNALVSYLHRGHPQAMLVPSARRHLAAGVTPSAAYNWSGYADGGGTTKAGTFTKVSGSWTTPSVTCGAEDQLTSNWVGLDGFGDHSVEQLGTFEWCYKGSPVYFTWWEMYPAGKVLLEAGKTLRPGDKISASVSRSGTSYTLKLADSTHPANSFTTTQTCPATTCLDESAEWISERPGLSTGIAPQARYNAFKVTNGAQTANGKAGTIGSYPAVSAITMVDSTDAYDLGTVSALTTANSFSTTWKNSF